MVDEHTHPWASDPTLVMGGALWHQVLVVKEPTDVVGVSLAGRNLASTSTADR